jgi:hypothetical protein
VSGEKLKVLELVSDGKISPEEGVRLIEALGEADRKSGGASSSGSSTGFGGQKFNPFGLGDVKIPKIDLGNLGEVLVEVKNNVVDMGKKAEAGFKRSRASRFFEMADYPVLVARPDDLDTAEVRLEVSAGKLKLRAADDQQTDLICGSVKRTPEEPQVSSKVSNNSIQAKIRSSIGRASLTLNPAVRYRLVLGNAAADTRLELAELDVEDLKVDNNAGNVSIELGERATRVNLKMENNAGSIRLAVPAQYAIRIKCSGNLSSHNLEKYGMELTDGNAKSGDWDDNPRGIEIDINQNVASFQLDWQRRDGVSVGYNPSDRRSAENQTSASSEWREED